MTEVNITPPVFEVVDIPPRWPATGDLVSGALLLVAAGAMFAGNLFALAAIFHSRLPRIPSYWFIINLTVTDLLWSVTVMPLAAVWEITDHWPFSKQTCTLYNTLDIGLSALCVYDILFITLDKYLYIRKPLFYDRVVKPWAVICLIIVLWLGCMLGSVLTVQLDLAEEQSAEENSCVFIMNDHYAIATTILIFVLPFSLLMLQSLRILHITRKHIRRIGQLRLSVCGAGAGTERALIRTSWRTIALTMAVVWTFALMEAPYWLTSLVASLCDCVDRRWLDDNLAYLYYLNPLVNPLLYLLTDRRYRKAATDLVNRCRARAAHPPRMSLAPTEITPVEHVVSES